MQHRARLFLPLGCALLVMGLAGCFQTAGDPAGGVGVAGVATFTPVANDVAPAVSLTPSPEIILPEAETATPEGEVALLITATPEATEEPLLFVTATPTQSFIFEDTPTPADQAASVGGDQPQQDIISDAQLTATAIFDRATQAYWETQTATAQSFFPTPTSEGGGGGDFFFPTATPPVQIQPPGPPIIGGSCQHTVSQGENLFRIALRYGSTVEAIAAANGITNVNLIRVGQVLTIPNCTGGNPVPPPGSGVGQPYTVRTGDTLFRIALTYNTTVEAIAANNPAITNINLIFIGQVIYIP